MNNKTRLTSVLTVASLAAAGVGVMTTDSASGAVAPRAVVASGLVSPLSAGVAADGTAYVSENFAGVLVKIRPGHKPQPVYHAARNVEVGGVSVGSDQVTFSLTIGKGRVHTRSLVMHLAGGKATRFANTGAFERDNNPDAGVTYGFRHLNKRCLAKVPKQVPARYSGIVDTHPYSTATSGSTTYVGDAAGNDILRINGHGHIKLVTVLPPVPLRVTKHRAKANGMPACTVGHRYFFEPVPTDVEVDGSGGLVVTTLTGASEAPGFGGQSRVYRVDPANGRTSLVRRGLAGAVGLAITAGGDYLVSQLFGNELSRVDANNGRVSHVRNVSQPAAVERVGGKVYVTSRVLAKKPMGRLLRFPG